MPNKEPKQVPLVEKADDKGRQCDHSDHCYHQSHGHPYLSDDILSLLVPTEGLSTPP